jgi:hypothetical protein
MGTHHSSSVLEHERRRPRDTSASWTPWPPVQETRIRSDDHPCAFSSSSSRAPLIPSCLSLPLLPLVGHEVWRKEKEMAGGEGRGWPPCRGVVFGGDFCCRCNGQKNLITGTCGGRAIGAMADGPDLLFRIF